MNDHSTSEGVMANDEPVAAFADAIREETPGSAFKEAHEKEAGATTVPKKQRKE